MDDQVMITCRSVNKTYPDTSGAQNFTALKDINLDIEAHEFVTLLGPSGCGKSTLLSMIAGFVEVTSGSLAVDGTPVTGPSPDKGVVFQEYALFPWLRVRANIAYGLRERGESKARQAEIVDKMLVLVGLETVADHYPSQLSGGLKQRVAIARVLANDPKILLMDEPFGALDEQRRISLQDELLRIWDLSKQTAVFVTHSIDEAVFLSERIIIMTPSPGQIKDIITVSLERPRDRTSDEFNALRRVVAETLRQ